jgi:hypothetical protein
MRSQESLLALFLILASLTPPHATASPISDAPAPLLTVVLTSGDTIQAVSVEPASIDVVRITNSSLRYRFLATNRVRLVLDETGADRTRDALERRRTVGRPPRMSEPVEPMERAVPERPLRYGPRASTKSFAITETSAFARLAGPAGRQRSYNVMFDVGRVFNVGSLTGLGATAFVGAGDGSAEVGVRGRFRYWLDTQSSIDFSPGLILSHEEPGISKGKGVGLVGQLSWSYSQLWSFAAQVYSVERTTETAQRSWFQNSYTVPGGRDKGVMLGFKLGGKPGLIAAPAAALAGIIFAGMTRNVYGPTNP